MTDNINLKKRKLFLLVVILILAILTYFIGLGSFYLTDRDEGEYASTVMTMLKNNDYIIPHLNGKVYLEKPILTFWLIAGSERIFGKNEFAVRFPSALSSTILLILLAFLLFRVTENIEFVIFSIAAIGFMPLYAMISRICETDMILTLFTTISILSFFMGTELEEPKDRKWYYLSWFCLAMSFLTKGPVAPAVILPTATIYTVIRKKFWHTFRRSNILVGIAIFLLINLPWFAAAYHRIGPDLWSKFFGDQIIKRGTKVLLGHGGGPFYYIPVILIGAFPFSASGIPGIWLAIKNYFQKKNETSSLERLTLLSALAILVVYIVFTGAATKLPHYILPSLPFLGILTAYFWHYFDEQRNFNKKWTKRIFWFILICLGFLFITLTLCAPLILPMIWNHLHALIKPNSSEYALSFFPPRFVLPPLLIALSVSGIIIFSLYFHKKKMLKKMAIAITIGGMIFTISGIILGTKFVNWLQEPEIRLVTTLKNAITPETKIVTFGLWKPTLFFYLDKELIPRFNVNDKEETKKLSTLLASPYPVYIITREILLQDCLKIPGFRKISNFDGYLLGGNNKALESGNI